MGIIDILQEYNTEKQMERFFKTMFQCKNADGISCIPPKPYSERFVNKIKDIIQVCESEADLVQIDLTLKRHSSKQPKRPEEELDDSV